jgi:outer membrane cobalamin receptor
MVGLVRSIVAIGLLAASAALAQQPSAIELETITVTGTRLPAPGNSTAAVTVIDAATAAATNRQSVPELLADVPGVHINIPGSRGSVGELFLRGGEPNFTAVLIDGIQVNDPTNTRGGSFDFSTLSVNEIERIEILRGPFSSIYGSDALSGIVNVITAEPGVDLRERKKKGGRKVVTLPPRLPRQAKTDGQPAA